MLHKLHKKSTTELPSSIHFQLIAIDWSNLLCAHPNTLVPTSLCQPKYASENRKLMIVRKWAALHRSTLNFPHHSFRLHRASRARILCFIMRDMMLFALRSLLETIFRPPPSQSPPSQSGVSLCVKVLHSMLSPQIQLRVMSLLRNCLPMMWCCSTNTLFTPGGT